MSNDIRSFAILPDPAFNENTIYSVTEQAGPFIGQPVPDSENVGSMMPFHAGKNIERVCNIDYKITVAGGINSAAQFVWKKEGDTQWTGYRDVRWGTDMCDPFITSSYTTAAALHCMFFSKEYSKLFITRGLSGSGATTNIELAVRRIENTDVEEYAVSTYDLKTASTTRGIKYADGALLAYLQQWGKVDGLELPNGELRLFVAYQGGQLYKEFYGSTKGNADATEIAIYGSKDGGTNWYVVQDQVLQKFATGQYKTDFDAGDIAYFKYMKVAASGDYMRIVLATPSTEASANQRMNLYCFVSSDYGSTWKELSSVVTTKARSGIASQTSLDDYYSPFAIVAANDKGSFLLVYEVNVDPADTSVSELSIKLSHHDGSFSTISGYDEATTNTILPRMSGKFRPFNKLLLPGGGSLAGTLNCTSMAAAIGPDMIYIAFNRVHDSNPRYAILSGLMIPRLTYSDPYTYIKWGEDISGCMQSQHLSRLDLRMVWAGDRIALSYGLSTIATDGAAAVNIDYVGVRSFGGNSKLPARSFQPVQDDEENGFWNNLAICENDHSGISGYNGMGGWDETGGIIIAAPTSITSYRNVRCPGGAGTGGVFVNENLLSTATPGITNGCILDGGVVGCIMKPSDTSSLRSPGSGTTPSYGFGVRSYSNVTAGNSALLAVEFFSDSSFKIYQRYTTSSTSWDILYTSSASVIDWTKFNYMRMVVWNGDKGSGSVEFVYANVGNNDFKSSGVLNFDTTPAHWVKTDFYNSGSGADDSQIGLFGFLDPNKHDAFIWNFKQFFLTGKSTKNSANCVNPSRVLGRLVSPVSTHVYDRTYVGWGGGGAVYDDNYSATPSYSYSTKNIFTPSPSSIWRSSIGTTHGTTSSKKEIIFDSQLYTNSGSAGERFVPDSFSLFNTCSSHMAIRFSDDPTFASGVLAHTFNTIVKSRLIISSHTTDSSLVRLTTTLTDHKYDGMILQISSGAQTGRSYRIDRNIGSDIYLVGNDTAALNHLTATTEVRIYDTQAVGVIDTSSASDTYRYMKLTFGEPESGFGTIRGTPEGYHSLGAMVVGSTFTFTLPFDWETKDSEKANLGVTTFSSGAKTAIKFGPSRRTFSGKIMGDLDGYRDKWTRTVRKMADFAGKPITLALQQTDLQSRETIYYARFKQEVVNTNVAWYKDSDGKFHRVGSFALKFDEEV